MFPLDEWMTGSGTQIKVNVRPSHRQSLLPARPAPRFRFAGAAIAALGRSRDRLLPDDRFRKAMKPLLMQNVSTDRGTGVAMTPAMLHADPADELDRKGRFLLLRLQAADALKYHLPAEKLQPKNVRLLLRISANTAT